MKKNLFLLIIAVFAVQNTSKAQLNFQVSDTKIGNTYNEIVDQIVFDFEENIGGDSVLYIHVDNAMLEKYYFFNDENICYQEIYFPNSYQEQSELKKGLIVNSQLNPESYEKINDNKWKIQKTDSSFIELEINDYSNKSAFIYTYQKTKY